MKEAPTISKDLVEYLERVYSPSTPNVREDNDPYYVTALVHVQRGEQRVVGHLRALYEQQQLEDPLNVHEDTQDA